MKIDCLEELNKNGIYLIKPKGNSMRPFLKNRCSAIVAKKEDRLKKFDVGLYARKDGTLVLHRVIEVLDDGYVFIGDNTFQSETVKEEDVFAVMIAFVLGKKTTDAKDEKYVAKVLKYYSNQGRRLKKIKRTNCLLAIKSRLMRLFRIKGKKNV